MPQRGMSSALSRIPSPTLWLIGPQTGVALRMNPFTYTPLPARVVFGAGSLARLGSEIEALGARRALVL